MEGWGGEPISLRLGVGGVGVQSSLMLGSRMTLGLVLLMSNGDVNCELVKLLLLIEIFKVLIFKLTSNIKNRPPKFKEKKKDTLVSILCGDSAI